MGKAPGFDNVSNEHVKYANEKLYVFLSLLYSSLLIHGFLPNSMMVTVIAIYLTTTTDPLPLLLLRVSCSNL